MLVGEAYIFINTIQMQVLFPFGSSKIFQVAFKTSFTTCFEVIKCKDCLIQLSRNTVANRISTLIHFPSRNWSPLTKISLTSSITSALIDH